MYNYFPFDITAVFSVEDLFLETSAAEMYTFSVMTWKYTFNRR